MRERSIDSKEQYQPKYMTMIPPPNECFSLNEAIGMKTDKKQFKMAFHCSQQNPDLVISVIQSD